MKQIELKLNGAAYSGWKRVSVVRSIEALCGRFDIEASDKVPFPIPRAGAVELNLYGNKILTGYTDMLSVDISSTEHVLNIVGRDKTGDLVDCSVQVTSQEMLNVTLRDVIEAAVLDFGITAIFDVEPAEKFKKFSFQDETCWDAIERACRLRGVFATTNENGQVLIQSYGTKRATDGIIMGENVLAARTSFNEIDRYSAYTVYGQQPGDDNTSAEATTESEGFATDGGVKRYRPLTVIAEGAVDNNIAQQRAEWEATVRAARAISTEIVVQGWQMSDGNLWRENMLVKCVLPQNGINGDMLIKEVAYTLDDKAGEKTRLSLVRPDAYIKQPDLKEEEIDIE